VKGKYYITICGNAETGKTTLTKLLADELDWRPCLELPATCSRGYYSVDSNLTSGAINGGRSGMVRRYSPVFDWMVGVIRQNVAHHISTSYFVLNT